MPEPEIYMEVFNPIWCSEYNLVHAQGFTEQGHFEWFEWCQ